jgi:large subunit ribosomal protein L18
MAYKKVETKKKTDIKGTSKKPRLSVFRSNKYISAQIINDEDGKTIVSASSMKSGKPNNVDSAVAVGKELAQKAKKASITTIVFDRGRYQYKGRIKALADAAREEGLVF